MGVARHHIITIATITPPLILPCCLECNQNALHQAILGQQLTTNRGQYVAPRTEGDLGDALMASYSFSLCRAIRRVLRSKGTLYM